MMALYFPVPPFSIILDFLLCAHDEDALMKNVRNSIQNTVEILFIIQKIIVEYAKKTESGPLVPQLCALIPGATKHLYIYAKPEKRQGTVIFPKIPLEG